jgi:UDP-N-acetylmuramoyl-L-alanyl-D-glutamate--2,6-diaminopimelate ligase
MLDNILNKIKTIIPVTLFRALNGMYHRIIVLLAAIWYGFPSRKIKVIGITGTKGKSSTVEILNTILEESGYKTALSNTIRFKIGPFSSENLYKMSMPGRFFIQRFIHKAVKNKCDYAIIEMTSQGSLLYRHKHIHMNTFLFTNLSPEHIESHGNYENYINAKVEIAKQLSRSKKANKAIIVNGDDEESVRFLECKADKKITYSIKDVAPFNIKKEGLEFTLEGQTVQSKLSGIFNLYNIVAAISAARNEGVTTETIIRAIQKFDGIQGRVEKIEVNNTKIKQDFTVIVDYAHTQDSLEKLYQVFQNSRKICVLGGTGGGRDKWKRKEMGKIADTYCDEIILTDEDPYDENPQAIIDDVAQGIVSKKPLCILDRRQAIKEALSKAKTGDTVLITGKGTDPYIMGPKNTRTPWSDAKVAKEELEKLLS